MSLPAAPAEAVIKKIISDGWELNEAESTPASFWFEKDDGDAGEKVGFYIPRPPDGIYYHLDLLNEIEQALVAFELELLPLSYH